MREILVSMFYALSSALGLCTPPLLLKTEQL